MVSLYLTLLYLLVLFGLLRNILSIIVPMIKSIYCHFNVWVTAGVAARETAQALRTLAQAARGVAASTKEPQAAAAMLDSAQFVMEGSAMLIHEAHQALVHPGDAESQQRLAQVA